jgi:hypothetical protein
MKILDPESTNCRAGLTFIHPFEPLIESHEKFKARLEEMQTEFRTEYDEPEATDELETTDKPETTDEPEITDDVETTDEVKTTDELETPDKAQIAAALKAAKKELVAFMEVFVGFIEEEVIGLCSKNHTKVRFASLSSIFKLGDTIYVPSADKGSNPDPEALRNQGDRRLWRLYRIKRRWEEEEGDLQLKVYAIDYDGEKYVCQPRTLKISVYDGEQEISSLSAFPLRYAENAEQIQRQSRTLGEKFVKYQKGLLTHSGWGLVLEGRDDKLPPRYITSDVVIDTMEAVKTHSDCMERWEFPKYIPLEHNMESYSYWNWKVRDGILEDSGTAEGPQVWLNEYTRKRKIEYCTKEDSFLSNWYLHRETRYELQDKDFELLPRRVFAYVLQERRFLAIDIRNVQPVGDDEMNTPGLIMDPNHESMLRGLVNSHFRRKELREKDGLFRVHQDIIANKGQGLIILLYGVPGVGKTSTAERIAHIWKKPLFPITCGSLGTKAVELEKNLKEVFRLAQKWDCILLLDEADVFLSERTPTALERNALVSVFLRELEYYDGILFLTTNLPGSIDEAFRSRIHISLYYPHLNEKTALAIWKVNINRLKDVETKHAMLNNDRPLTIDERGIRKFAKHHFRTNEDGKGRWNGRQIRNAFLIASALAQFEKDNPSAIPPTVKSETEEPPCDITPRHFQVVANASKGFERYLSETRGRTASETMFQRGQRADFILSPPEKLSEMPSGENYLHSNSQSRGGKTTLGPSGPFRSQQGWGGLSTASETQQHPTSDPQWVYGAGNPYGGHQGYTTTNYHEQQFTSPHQDPRVISNPDFSGTAQSHRNIGFQGSPSPSPFRQSLPARYPSVNPDGALDTDSDSDA